MKLKVTIEFESESDMVAYFSNKAPEVAVQPEPTVVEEPKKEAPKKKREVFPKAKAEPKVEPKAEVVEEEIVEHHEEPQIDRAAILANIGTTVSELKSKGIKDQEIASTFMGIFSKMGKAGCKISELDDQTLAVFNSHFEPEIAALTQQQPSSFI